MPELMVVRHAQASFGADNYDQLSELGHRQSEMAGEALREMGWVPDRLVTGTLTRQKETLHSMGFTDAPEEHAGWNEYDFHDLLRVKHSGTIPDLVQHDRKTHFRTLRETLREWQDDGLHGAAESWADFKARIQAARQFSTEGDAQKVLVISSGGAIGQLVASAMSAPPEQMIALNLQVKNTSMTRFIFSSRAFFLHEFNATPHFAPQARADMLTYS
ncbi:bifunctional RNase H/acid phosphatase [Falsiruegeria litorea R37]|uniref:Bifunctional RNase H/acid phosphatase n=1 Tax=Falsiruegeria litorea R37 TaxID=1200284 RepID=A0A1Y5SGQ1_9RHOB|nr:histidine phosphatase family protein [Falsiruegeria litorea]SLN40469.1 bifunctional RNase H/acid phosphatase [Falsiruegeria litorea R37]